MPALVSGPEVARSAGPWTLIEEIGRGGHGVVWIARHEGSGEEAAVKVLRRDAGVAASAIRREIRALVKRSVGRPHPGLVRFVDHGLEGGVPWVAMELVVGESLEQLAADASRGTLLRIARRLARALSFLHGEGLIHGDLKPANVIVREGRWPVLVDFGLVTTYGGARYRESVDSGAIPGGTPAYMAPEQCRGEPGDGRVDLYALGCILYELVTGAPPFTGSPGEIVRAHLTEAPEPPSRVAEVPAELDALILALLAKDPAGRLGHADDVASRLELLGASLEEGEREPPEARAHVYRPRLVGRAELVTEIERWLASGAAPGVLLLSGESGAGKTRILVEVAARARRAGQIVLVGAGDPWSDVPLEVMRGPLEAIADLCIARGSDEAARVLGANAKVLAPYEPTLLALPSVASMPDPPELPPRMARARMLRALVETLARLASPGRGLLLLMDDLQWADRLSLDFLDLLSASPAEATGDVRVLGAQRAGEATHLTDGLVASRRARRLSVGRLDGPAIGAMAAGMLGVAAAPAALARFLESRSEGTPLFVAEYLRLAVERHLLGRDRMGRWSAAGELLAEAEEIALPLPTAVREVVSERLAGLSLAGRKAVGVAAVLGRESMEDLWGLAAGLPEDEADDVLVELHARQVIESDHAGTLRFTHDRIREEILGSLDPSQAAELHRAAATAIEQLHAADLGAHRGALGRHWEAAGERERAAVHFLAGAKDAVSRYAYGEGARLFRAHLALVDEGSPGAVEARWELGECLYEGGHVQEGLGEVEHAARGAVNGPIEAAVLVSLAVLQRAALRRAESQATGEAALAAARRLGDRAREAQAIAGLASHRVDEGRFSEALEGFEQARRTFQELGDRRQESRMTANVALMSQALGRRRVAEEAYLGGLQLAREMGDRVQEGTILSNLANLAADEDRYADAHAFCEQALGVHREVGNGRFEALVLARLADLVRRRDPGQAIVLHDRALSLARRLGDRRIEGKVLATSEVLRGTPRAAEVEGALRRAVELLDEGRDDQIGWYARSRLAEELARDRIEEARRFLDEARPTVLAMGNLEHEALFLCLVATVEIRGGSSAAALDAASRAVVLVERSRAGTLAPAVALLGLARAAAGEDASAELHRAEELLARLDPGWIPHDLRALVQELRAAAAPPSVG